MILKLFNSIINGSKAENEQDAVASGNVNRPKDNQMVDVAHEAMRSDAIDLNKLLTVGQPVISRRNTKDRIRRRVKKHIAPELYDENIVEEVTEKILDAAEFDPFYREQFDRE
jgi:hypothetical protein